MTDETTVPTVTCGEITTTASLTELGKALAAAQGKIRTAAKDTVNPHFGKTYADLASVWEACREPLSSNGLSVIQQPVSDGGRVGVVTTLLHASGQWMRSTLWVAPDRAGPQAVGSALTYARRYSLAAFVGIAPDDDDDGNAATGGDKPRAARPPAAKREASPPAEREPGGDDAPASTGSAASGEQKNYVLQAFKRLGWPIPHQRSWLQKHVGVQGIGDLTAPMFEIVKPLLDNHQTEAA